MKKVLGLFFVFIGLLILLKSFYPEFYQFLSPYAYYIKASFWGVALVAFGLYLISKDRTWRTAIGALFVVYLALYLIVPETPGGWNFEWGWNFNGGKIEGQMHSLGTFKASNLELNNVPAEITFVNIDGDSIKAETNLPLEIERNGDSIRIYCKNCEHYKNGKLIIEVGKDINLTEISMKNVVGRVNSDIANFVEGLSFNDVVGDVNIDSINGDWISFNNVVGDIDVNVDELKRFDASDIIGDISLTIPREYKVQLLRASSISKLETQGNIYEGTKTLKVSFDDMIGRISIKEE